MPFLRCSWTMHTGHLVAPVSWKIVLPSGYFCKMVLRLINSVHHGCLVHSGTHNISSWNRILARWWRIVPILLNGGLHQIRLPCSSRMWCSKGSD